jgi:hypothetical protein
MFANIASHGSLGKLQKTLVVAIALVVLFCSISVGKAYAWGDQYAFGATARVDKFTISILDITQPTGTYLTIYGPNLTVYRSPKTSGGQMITVKTFLDLYTIYGTKYGWYPVLQTTETLPIASGWYFAGFSDVRFALRSDTARGYYRVRYQVTWVANGQQLAWAEIVPNIATDFYCVNSGLRLCRSLAGSFQVGIYGTNIW